jgi:Ca-activated chloride channel family protein
MAADIAQDLGIKVYTIGVGSRDKAPMPAYDPFGNMTYVMADVEIDEALLREIAAKTNGQYFRASDNKALKEIYAQTNELEKSKVEITHYTSYNELYMGWLLLALILLAAEFLMARMVLNRLPM